MGVNKLLKAGIEKEQAQLKDVTAKADEKKLIDSPMSNLEKTTSGNNSVKNKGGRPTNKEKGLKSRKQYTLTLKEDDYNSFLEAARTNDLSFAKFMEKAAFEYIENHKRS